MLSEKPKIFGHGSGTLRFFPTHPGSTEDLEERLLRSLKIDRDLLIAYRLDKARTWYQTAPEDAFAGYAGAVNPTYITLSRRAHRDRFVTELPANSHGSIFNKLRT